MKKVLIAGTILLFCANISIAQNATPTAASPASSASATLGTETTEQVVVTSQELDISREAIVPSLGATRYTVGPDRIDSQARGGETRHLTKPCSTSPQSPRI